MKPNSKNCKCPPITKEINPNELEMSKGYFTKWSEVFYKLFFLEENAFCGISTFISSSKLSASFFHDDLGRNNTTDQLNILTKKTILKKKILFLLYKKEVLVMSMDRTVSSLRNLLNFDDWFYSSNTRKWEKNDVIMCINLPSTAVET